MRELPDFFGRLVAQIVGEDGDERGRHRPFPYQTANQVGDAVGQNESVGRRSGAEEQSDALVPEVPEDAAENRNKGDDRGCLEDLLLFIQEAESQPKPTKISYLKA